MLSINQDQLLDMPVLKGSAKQVKWAKNIRENFAREAHMLHMEDYTDEHSETLLERSEAAWEEILEHETTAAYWIRVRNENIRDLLQKRIQSYSTQIVFKYLAT